MKDMEKDPKPGSFKNFAPNKLAPSLKTKFVKAGQWYLDLIQDLDKEITQWKDASIREFEKNPKSYLVQKYMAQAMKKEAQKQALIKFYAVCESVISEFENQLWVKEQFETLMLLQVAALKQGKNINVMESVSLILKGPATHADKLC